MHLNNEAEVRYIQYNKFISKEVALGTYIIDGKPVKVVSTVDSPDGLYAVAFIDNEEQELVIAFRGTELKFNDIFTDFLIVNRRIPSQFDMALHWVQDVKANWELGRKVIYTGHSLGGGIAVYCSAKTGDKAVVFNEVGINQCCNFPAKAFDNVKSYCVCLDIVSHFGEKPYKSFLVYNPIMQSQVTLLSETTIFDKLIKMTEPNISFSSRVYNGTYALYKFIKLDKQSKKFWYEYFTGEWHKLAYIDKLFADMDTIAESYVIEPKTSDEADSIWFNYTDDFAPIMRYYVTKIVNSYDEPISLEHQAEYYYDFTHVMRYYVNKIVNNYIEIQSNGIAVHWIGRLFKQLLKYAKEGGGVYIV